MGNFKGNERLELLGYEIIGLISKGKSEDLNTTLKQLKEGNVLHNLYEKYKDEFFINLSDEGVYDLDEWEKIVCDNYSYIERRRDVERRMGIQNDKGGLLLLVYIILEIKAK